MEGFSKEVYIAYGIKGEVLYVGQGNIGRNAHCYSGASHNKQLNRYYFLNGEDDSIRTKIHSYTNCEIEALEIEVATIRELSPLYNATNQVKIDVTTSSSFKASSIRYYDLHCAKNLEVNQKVIKNLDCKMEDIKSMNQEFSEIVSTIGIEEIKNTSFNKTKSKGKYNKFVGISDISKSKTSAFKSLSIKEGDFLLYSEIKEKLQSCFDRQSIGAVAKATDIKDIFNVKRTTRGGVEGFLIGSKL